MGFLRIPSQEPATLYRYPNPSMSSSWTSDWHVKFTDVFFGIARLLRFLRFFPGGKKFTSRPFHPWCECDFMFVGFCCFWQSRERGTTKTKKTWNMLSYYLIFLSIFLGCFSGEFCEQFPGKGSRFAKRPSTKTRSTMFGSIVGQPGPSVEAWWSKLRRLCALEIFYAFFFWGWKNKGQNCQQISCFIGWKTPLVVVYLRRLLRSDWNPLP